MEKSSFQWAHIPPFFHLDRLTYYICEAMTQQNGVHANQEEIINVFNHG